ELIALSLRLLRIYSTPTVVMSRSEEDLTRIHPTVPPQVAATVSRFPAFSLLSLDGYQSAYSSMRGGAPRPLPTIRVSEDSRDVTPSEDDDTVSIALSSMDNHSKSRRFSTITQLNTTNEKSNHCDRRVSIEDGALSRKMTGTFGNLALFKDDDDTSMPNQSASIFSAYTTPGPKERATSEHGKKANLGIMLGVYLPTIQHILGVTMFIRLFWIVGIAGLGYTTLILLLCSLCTFLTSISLSAVATNGVVESGGAYFMISRNLGAEFGSAVGILFYLANTVATSMYLVGGVEVMLMYLAPGMTLSLGMTGSEEHDEGHTFFGSQLNNFRFYGTLFLLLEVLIVAMGVKFVQLMAPVSLMCVIMAVLAVFAGGIANKVTDSGQRVCELNDSLIMTYPMKLVARDQSIDAGNISDNYCVLCDKSIITDLYCDKQHSDDASCTQMLAHEVECINGFPGFNVATLMANLQPSFLNEGESKPQTQAVKRAEVRQDHDSSFFLLLAIWFPAVTGILTGTNMSGDLADPQKSIPGGTIAATSTTSLIYFGLALIFGSCIDRRVLRDKFGKSLDQTMVVASLAWPSPWIVTIGSFLSTFGAALQCLCSAPRLLQSIAKDDVIPALSPFARVTKSNEPFLGLLFTAVIAEAAILLGEVDAIAEVLDFFFLMCYASVNMICFLHSILKAPNWRPRFKYYHWSLSLIGAFLCFFIMFASDWKKALIACVLTFSIYKYVEWKGAKREWGDGIRGLALTTAQYSLLKVEDKDPHPKNWRPQLMLMLTSDWKDKEVTDNRIVSLINLAAQLKAGQGLAIAVGLVAYDKNEITRKELDEIKSDITRRMSKSRLRGFGKTLVYRQNQAHGTISSLFQSIGIGGLRPNTILLNWPNFDDYEHLVVFAEQIILGVQMENCMMLTKGITAFPEGTDRLCGTIDVWWIVQDGGILMLIAYLLKQHKVWRGCRLRVFVVSESSDSSSLLMVQKNLQKHIYQLRIDAELFVVNMNTDDELTREVQEKTAEMELKRLPKLEEMRARSVTGSYLNDSYSNDETLPRSETTRAFARSVSTMIKIGEQGETSFTEGRYADLFADDQSRDFSSEAASTANGNGTAKLNVQKMNTAVKLNKVIMENSPDSQLVILTMPIIPKKIDAFINQYMTYLDVASEGLKRVIFVHGSGKEVITTQS
ncbi:hypothetical protein PFISCL1PPCAC_6634, partial [Pristionchus fissidentatus]